MPTLINPPHGSANAGMEEQAADDGSVTILMDDHEKIDDDTPLISKKGPAIHQQTPVSVRRHDKSVTFDDDTILCSTSKPHSSYSKRRRQTLDSEISLSLDDYKNNDSTESIDPSSPPASKWRPLHSSSSSFPTISVKYEQHDVENLPWPNRDEYRQKYHDFVKKTISDFQQKNPERLRDYRTMTPEEKAQEQQRVLALLKRLGISRGSSGSSSDELRASQAQNNKASNTFTSPFPQQIKKILDETLSPAFTPSPCHKLAARCSAEKPYEEIPIDEVQSPLHPETSELLVSMDVDLVDTVTGGPVQANSSVDDRVDHHQDSFEFPVNDDHPSDSSMELVRRASKDAIYSDDDNDNLSHETPEDQIIQDYRSKRLASASGKRGSDMFRQRLNDDNDYGMDISNRLGRLSLSPLDSPPENLFVASQSPISPKLTCHTPEDKDEFGERDGGRIDWGGESDNRRRSNLSVDSLATNTPPVRYRSEKDKNRCFREVPLNVALKDKATFHLDKLPVKKAELARSSRPAKNRLNAIQNRRLVNFPDPFTRYNNRTRRALKEIYATIRNAEREHEKGEIDIPAAGVFFSLTEQQIIDVCIKLLLHDLSEKPNIASEKVHASVLKGSTLVVVRSKEDTAIWERALREQTGCSVNNHSALPLSERIRSSSAEKACAHDVVLTTFDAMKSPDLSIPVTNEGYAILTKGTNNAGWHSSRAPSQFDSSPQPTKQLSILHRINFKRIIFVDSLGRKCYLAKGGTARAAAAVALSGDTRVVFFQESESDGSDPLRALRKSDKKAYESVSKVLRLGNDANDRDERSYEDDEGMVQNPLEMLAMDFKDLC